MTAAMLLALVSAAVQELAALPERPSRTAQGLRIDRAHPPKHRDFSKQKGRPHGIPSVRVLKPCSILFRNMVLCRGSRTCECACHGRDGNRG